MFNVVSLTVREGFAVTALDDFCLCLVQMVWASSQLCLGGKAYDYQHCGTRYQHVVSLLEKNKSIFATGFAGPHRRPGIYEKVRYLNICAPFRMR